MAKGLDPKLDVAAYRAKLDALIERVAAAAAAGKTPREKAQLIGVQIFEREGLTNKEGVKRPDRLLDLKQGDCFGFSFLYLCIGQRLRMPLGLVTAPEHVFVRYEDCNERFNVETTEKGELHDTDDYLREHVGAQRFSQVGGTDLASLPVPRALGDLFSNWGAALGEMGKLAEACEKFAKALEINPREAKAYYNWGNALAVMGKPAEACEQFAKAVEINPRYATAYSNWGNALTAMGKQAEACEKYAKAVEINPRLAEAYCNWGAALAAMGKAPEACEKYAKAVEINPRHAGAYTNWGNALQAMGKQAEACEKHAKAVEINPRDAEAYSNWGSALNDMGKPAEACEKCAKAVEINPG
jgi:tetratricopeptide (TPR) repeat protein